MAYIRGLSVCRVWQWKGRIYIRLSIGHSIACTSPASYGVPCMSIWEKNIVIDIFYYHVCMSIFEREKMTMVVLWFSWEMQSCMNEYCWERKDDIGRLIFMRDAVYIRIVMRGWVCLRKKRWQWSSVIFMRDAVYIRIVRRWETMWTYKNACYWSPCTDCYPDDLGPLLLTWFNFNPSMDK